MARTLGYALRAKFFRVRWVACHRVYLLDRGHHSICATTANVGRTFATFLMQMLCCVLIVPFLCFAISKSLQVVEKESLAHDLEMNVAREKQNT